MDTARLVMWQATHAAHKCIQRGVFHRDIKLDNLLVNPETLEIKLIDFGCRCLLRESGYDVFCGMYYVHQSCNLVLRTFPSVLNQ